jgi:hypothetical protein
MFVTPLLWIVIGSASASGDATRLESPQVLVEIDARTGEWSLLDKLSHVCWPTVGKARAGTAPGLTGDFTASEQTAQAVCLRTPDGATVTFALVGDGGTLEISYEGQTIGDVRVLDDALNVTREESGAVIVPCREGLLIPADSGMEFRQTFGTSEYEGCHMNILGFLKSGSALAVTWDDAYVWPEIQSKVDDAADGKITQRIATGFSLQRTARAIRLTPMGKGDWNTLAAGYRRIAEKKGLAVTMQDRIRRNARAELLVGAANVKLWTCLERRMSEDSTKEEAVQVHWTFDEAAAVAEHLAKDVGISRCLFTIGGWTEGGYDCRHPDNLPANPECGGNESLADAIRRIQALGYVASLHDNYQDMYRDAKSWDPAHIEKTADGSLIAGGRWLGGRAYMVCAPRQLEMAMRPQNLPAIQELFAPWSYFIDTTYAVPPRECADPNHPLTRNDDIAWKSQLSDRARELFGLFGSECGREWALPHSDFFEGLVGVAGRCFHNLQPETFGAQVIPFWEMVYHDCQICYGKYGYAADQAGPYVAHHVLTARPLNYHAVPDHRYWLDNAREAAPRSTADVACFTRTDNGWTAGLHPTDAFLKTTQEVLGPLHEATANQRLVCFEYLVPDKSVRRAVYGAGPDATTVVVNFGVAVASVHSTLWGDVRLPRWGFVIDAPRYAACYVQHAAGRDYPDGTLFTVQAIEGQDLAGATKVRVFHGFGDAQFVWRGQTYEVLREEVIAP